MANGGPTTTSIIVPLIGTLIAIAAFKKLIALWKASNRLPYPPGPKPLPIVGNLFDFPKNDLAACYYNWGKKYNSDILHASSLGFHVIVLNSLEDAEELFERRASNYSDRLMTPALELLGLVSNMAIMPHGPTWRKHRRIAQQNFRLDMMSAHEPIQARRIHIMLKALLDDPDNLFTHNKVLSLSIPLEFMYGYDVKSLDDPYITDAQRMVELAVRYFNPDSTLINFFPILGKIPAWIPGASTQKVAATVRDIIHNLETEPMERVIDAVDKGVAVPSVLSEFVEAKRGTPEFEDEAAIVSQLAFTIYGAASDTVISALASLFYVLVTRPDIQKKGQDEIDRVIGTERLPQFSDRASLPYTDALYRELLRFYPPTPLAIPHRVKEDDTYKGYFIPKGTIVSANVWAMARDENLYPDPHEFKPERFIDEHGELTNDARILTYGFGRRICIGKYNASATMWMTIASLLACFNISKAKDAQGKEIEISDDFEFLSVTTHKTPFKCSITPRSEVIRRLVEEAVAAEKLKPHGNVA
ncbi:cytochrome P450 [Pholiota conissans]|uniref:Cytochrome P450 n=1 Tax=Pholiota conissans TaxID=109636 RepID=A0A9P6CYZ5_9AGAR|nr:cytochrome P450 [Pholiota conissans]